MTKEQRQMIEDCETRSASLSDWECQFVDNLSRRESLTTAQDEKLSEIWARATTDG